MITATDPKSIVAAALYRAAEYLDHGGRPEIQNRDYHDHKACQLLDATADLLVAEARIAAWFVDLGFDGQCVEDSSIGGIPCLSSLENS